MNNLEQALDTVAREGGGTTDTWQATLPPKQLAQLDYRQLCDGLAISQWIGRNE